MSENIYVLNENGTVCGLRDRVYVHNNGLLHLAVQCWVMNKKGEVLIQRRSATKDKSAGKWDASFGGHCIEIETGKDILIENVIKEGKEELEDNKFKKFVQCLKVRRKSKNPIGQKVRMSDKSVRVKCL